MKARNSYQSRSLKLTRYARACVAVLFVTPFLTHAASLCQHAWDGDKVVSEISGRPAHLQVPLRDRQQRVTEVTVDQILAFSESKSRIYQVAGITPRFIICDGAAPNAFATTINNIELVGVTVGMLRIANGDRDIAAAIVGHELAHHTRGHNAEAIARDAFIGLAAVLIGAALDARYQRRSGVYTGIGVNVAMLGSRLVSRKFDRDQEREADDVGFEYVVSAGFNPQGTVRLAELLRQSGRSTGLFFDTHPGWDERAERFRTMIAANPRAQELIAKAAQTSTVAAQSTVELSKEQSPVVVARVEERSDTAQTASAAVAGTAIAAYPDLMSAVMQSDRKAVAHFLSQGADVNERKNGMTYLIAAAQNGDLEMVKFLIGKGADVNGPDNRGLPPLVHASSVRPSNPALTRFLQDAGAKNPFSAR